MLTKKLLSLVVYAIAAIQLTQAVNLKTSTQIIETPNVQELA